MGAEQERGLSGWQSEFGMLAEMYVRIHDAIVLLTRIIEGLDVDVDAMQRTWLGPMLAKISGRQLCWYAGRWKTRPMNNEDKDRAKADPIRSGPRQAPRSSG